MNGKSPDRRGVRCERRCFSTRASIGIAHKPARAPRPARCPYRRDGRSPGSRLTALAPPSRDSIPVASRRRARRSQLRGQLRNSRPSGPSPHSLFAPHLRRRGHRDRDLSRAAACLSTRRHAIRFAAPAEASYSRRVAGSRVGTKKGNAVRTLTLPCRGCPRNCKRRAALEVPLELSLREGGGRATSREPGDLPAARIIQGPRVEGERRIRWQFMTSTTLGRSGRHRPRGCCSSRWPRCSASSSSASSASRTSRPCTTPPTTIRHSHGLPLPLKGRVMSIFRNVVFVAALAGLVAGVVMTGIQQVTTVPLILQAEIFEQRAAQAATTMPLHRTPMPRAGGRRMSMTRKAGRRPTASSAPPSRARQHRHRHRLRAAADRRVRAGRRHRRLAAGPVLGPRRLRRVHAGARPRPAAGTAGDARRPIWARGRSGGWRTAARHRRRAGAAGLPPHRPAGGARRGADRRAAYRRRAAARRVTRRRCRRACITVRRRGGDRPTWCSGSLLGGVAG